jgi:1-acyl-sn-glycerol-3-phosphate acyltransferase
MFRYIRAIAICFFDILFAYFGWMIPFSRHPERYPLQYRYEKVRKLALKVVKALRVDFYINHPERLELPGTYLFIANHSSMFDAFITMCLSPRPIIFVGKIEVLKFPFFGRVMKALDSVFIERNNLRMEVEVLKRVKLSLTNQVTSWVIYPEGTRNKVPDGPLLPFKPGTFKLAVGTNTTIIPFAIYGSYRPLQTKFHLKRYPVHVSFLPPITPDDFKDLNTIKLSEQVRDLIQAEVDVLRGLNQKMIPVKPAKKKKEKRS